MFRKNENHEQTDLFDYDFSAQDRLRKMVEKCNMTYSPSSC